MEAGGLYFVARGSIRYREVYRVHCIASNFMSNSPSVEFSTACIVVVVPTVVYVLPIHPAMLLYALPWMNCPELALVLPKELILVTGSTRNSSQRAESVSQRTKSS